MRIAIALIALLSLGTTQAFAQCDPTTATKGMLGCSPTAPSAAGSDYLYLWQPGLFPNSQHKITVDSLFAGRGGGGGNLSSPGPIGNVTPNTIVGTQMAANSLVIGSPAGGDKGPGSLNLVSLWIGGVDISTPPSFTPINVGSGAGGYVARTSNVIIATGQCAHACEIYDTSAQGFWVDQTGAAPVAGVSQFIPAGSSWYSPVGLTTSVAVMPFATGIIGGTVQ